MYEWKENLQAPNASVESGLKQKLLHHDYARLHCSRQMVQTVKSVKFTVTDSVPDFAH